MGRSNRQQCDRSLHPRTATQARQRRHSHAARRRLFRAEAMKSIRARLSMALIVLVAFVSLLAAMVTYHRVLSETSTLFDYQLRQMALSLRGQISLAPRIEVPPDQGDTDFVVQIWDIFGARTYLSRPGLPLINQTVLGYADLSLRGEPWRAYGLQTADGVIQIAQPVRVREALARAAAERVEIG